MRTIKLNGKNLHISASEERALFILVRYDFAAKRAEFVEGTSPRYQHTILPKDRARWRELGITEIYPGGGSVREKRFFKENPRCRTGIFGNPRRINAILKALHRFFLVVKEEIMT